MTRRDPRPTRIYVQRKFAKDNKQKLDDTFDCLICGDIKTVTCRLDYGRKMGHLTCQKCMQSFLSTIGPISKGVDVYHDWVDWVDSLHRSRRSHAPSPQVHQHHQPGFNTNNNGFGNTNTNMNMNHPRGTSSSVFGDRNQHGTAGQPSIQGNSRHQGFGTPGAFGAQANRGGGLPFHTTGNRSPFHTSGNNSPFHDNPGSSSPFHNPNASSPFRAGNSGNNSPFHNKSGSGSPFHAGNSGNNSPFHNNSGNNSPFHNPGGCSRH
ncbi:hypothetical protein BGX29_011908 [Mortierella sp. GBA35]|nr:hypothetical protein BGX29_011908 [Mortierella sp. GBA35]